MSDDEHHGHDVHFESADSGASLTYPQQAGTVRKNGFLVIKGRPCKVSCSKSRLLLTLSHTSLSLTKLCPPQVSDVSTSKTGKHGHAKCHFVAIDIFTGKKYEDLTPYVPSPGLSAKSLGLSVPVTINHVAC